MALIQAEHALSYLTFDEEKHCYTLDGRAVPGVTTFIHGSYPTSEALVSWKMGKAAEFVMDQLTEFSLGLNVPRQTGVYPFNDAKKSGYLKVAKQAWKTTSSEAASVGTLVHEFAYLWEIGRKDEAEKLFQANVGNKEFENGVCGFQEWEAKNKDTIISTEQIVASVKHQFAGKFDRLARRGNRVVLSDFKTSGGFYVDMFIQLAAYRLAIAEWMDIKVDAFEILRFDKKTGQPKTLMIKKASEMKEFEAQAIRCRKTFAFREWEKDKRFAWGGK